MIYPITIALIAPTLRRAKNVAHELAEENVDNKTVFDSENQMVAFADGTQIWYGTAGDPERWAGRWYDQLFVCDGASIDYGLRSTLLRKSYVPDTFAVQYL